MTTEPRELDLSFGQVIEARREARLRKVRKQAFFDGVKAVFALLMIFIMCGIRL